MSANYNLPNPIIDVREEASVAELTARYNKMMEPSKLSKAGAKVKDMIPAKVKEVGANIAGSITEAELYGQAMGVIADGFKIIEEQAAKFTISEKEIIKRINRENKENEISSINEICLARSYVIGRIVNKNKNWERLLALVEGGTTGFAGFAGLPFNLVLSTFLYYRAVQTVAMFYGYDVKNDPAELIIASEVFVSSLNPQSVNSNEIGSIIGKIMLISELTTIKQASKKSWEALASMGGMGLMLVQMRALAHNSARKALEKTGKKGLESSVFKNVFSQIGKGMSKKVVTRSVMFVSVAIGACFDTAQMNKILEFADVFYSKRYLAEKEVRIQLLCAENDGVTVV